MGSVNPKFQGKNGNVQTFEAITALLLGGQLVVPSGTTGASGLQTIVAAGANAINCVGVASADAVPASLQAANTNTTSPYDAGYPAIDASVPDPTVAVYTDCVIRVTYGAGAVAFGAKLKCGATGTVVAHVSGTDAPERCIGSCAEPGGTAGGVVALAKIYPL